MADHSPSLIRANVKYYIIISIIVMAVLALLVLQRSFQWNSFWILFCVGTIAVVSLLAIYFRWWRFKFNINTVYLGYEDNKSIQVINEVCEQIKNHPTANRNALLIEKAEDLKLTIDTSEAIVGDDILNMDNIIHDELVKIHENIENYLNDKECCQMIKNMHHIKVLVERRNDVVSKQKGA